MSDIEEVLKKYPEAICTTTDGPVNGYLIGEWYIMVDSAYDCVFLLPTGHLVYGEGYLGENIALENFPKDRYVGKATYHHTRKI